jgi:small multidrug resistance family-3 protein
VTVARSIALFVLAALAEIGGAWLVWQGWREHRGVFVAGSLAWGVVVDKFRPDRFDVIGAAICLLGVAVIMYAPRT